MPRDGAIIFGDLIGKLGVLPSPVPLGGDFAYGSAMARGRQADFADRVIMVDLVPSRGVLGRLVAQVETARQHDTLKVMLGEALR
jgi:hypothetical protein